MDWIKYNQVLWNQQRLPPAHKHVLVQLAEKVDEGLPPAVVVGYLRFATGDKATPLFTTPGVGGEVVGWCDCLTDSFTAPLWG